MSPWVWIVLVWVATSPIAVAVVLWLLRGSDRAYPAAGAPSVEGDRLQARTGAPPAPRETQTGEHALPAA